MAPEPDGDGFKTVGRHTRLQCRKKGCTGTCPHSVVKAGRSALGVPAKCFECGRPYQLNDPVVTPGNRRAPAATATAKPQEPNGSGASPGSLHKELLALKKEVADLRASKPKTTGAAQPGTEQTQSHSEALPLSADDKTAVKALQQQIQQLNDLGPELRTALCEPKGGYEHFVASLEAQRQAIFAKHRGSLPLDLQKQKSQAHLEAMQKRKNEAQAGLEDLQKQQAALALQIEQQQRTLTETETKLQAAKIEAATIAQAAVQAAARQISEAAGAGVSAPQRAVSAVTAQAVKSFFQTLPPTVAQHPEGIDTVRQVMALLDKLDAAAANADERERPATDSMPPGAPTAAPEPSPLHEQMQLDDDFLDQMAEAATEPSGDGEDIEARKERVAAAKARLQKPTDLIWKWDSPRVRKDLKK